MGIPTLKDSEIHGNLCLPTYLIEEGQIPVTNITRLNFAKFYNLYHLIVVGKS